MVSVTLVTHHIVAAIDSQVIDIRAEKVPRRDFNLIGTKSQLIDIIGFSSYLGG